MSKRNLTLRLMDKKHIEISVTEYAAMRNITRQAVLSALKNSWAMDGYVSHRKIGKQYIIKVKAEFAQ